MVGASILAMILEADVSDTLVVEISLEWIVHACGGYASLMDGVTSCKMKIRRKGEEVRGDAWKRIVRQPNTLRQHFDGIVSERMLCCLSSSKHQACPSEKGRHTEIEI